MKKEDLRIDCEVRRKGAHPLWLLSPKGLDPIKLAYNQPVYQQLRYAELAISSPAVGETITSTQCTDPERDGQADWPGKYGSGDY